MYIYIINIIYNPMCFSASWHLYPHDLVTLWKMLANITAWSCMLVPQFISKVGLCHFLTIVTRFMVAKGQIHLKKQPTSGESQTKSQILRCSCVCPYCQLGYNQNNKKNLSPQNMLTFRKKKSNKCMKIPWKTRWSWAPSSINKCLDGEGDV